jgi:hypothetical protein
VKCWLAESPLEPLELMTKNNPRRGEQVQRNLRLIALLDGQRLWHGVDELQELYNDRYGTTYCGRTIRRDLDILYELGIVDRQRIKTIRSFAGMYAYRLCRQGERWARILQLAE